MSRRPVSLRKVAAEMDAASNEWVVGINRRTGEPGTVTDDEARPVEGDRTGIGDGYAFRDRALEDIPAEWLETNGIAYAREERA